VRSQTSDYLDYAQRRPSANVIALSAAGLLVFVLHCVAQFVLYRGMVLDKWPRAHSDVLVFALPSFLALAAYALVFSRWVMSKPWNAAAKIAIVVVLTLVVGFLSFWGSLLIPLNTYGE
jgi:FtsH-binding integral membrane protein